MTDTYSPTNGSQEENSQSSLVSPVYERPSMDVGTDVVNSVSLSLGNSPDNFAENQIILVHSHDSFSPSDNGVCVPVSGSLPSKSSQRCTAATTTASSISGSATSSGPNNSSSPDDETPTGSTADGGYLSLDATKQAAYGIQVINFVLDGVAKNSWEEKMGHGKKRKYLEEINKALHASDGPLKDV